MNDMELWQKEKESKWYKKLAHLFESEDVFWNNEVKANLFVCACLIMLIIVLFLSYFLAYIGVFDVSLHQMGTAVLVNAPILLLSVILCQLFHGSKHWIKYVLLIACLSTSIALTSILSIFVTLVICIPVVLSCRYYSRLFTIQIAIISIIGMIISEIIYGHNSLVDLNLVSVPVGSILMINDAGLRDAVVNNGYDVHKYIINLFRGSFATRMLFFTIISTICAELSRRAHEMVLEQAATSKKAEAISTELNMATQIQTAALPKLFPAFPTKPEIDIHATMNPAKEVGGDFYDYYLLDDDHIMLVMADVSGKSVPAALFMMISKILIKTYSSIYHSPAQIAAEVNKALCDGNDTGMFVTAWIGIFEISTGTLTAVDAGHEYPFVRHKNGDYEVVKDKKSFVLGGMETSKYNEFSLHIDKGDTIFLYTDGVTEATNVHNELFGMNRLEAALNKHKDDPQDIFLHSIRSEIDQFVGNAPQFDDITMLSFVFSGNS